MTWKQCEDPADPDAASLRRSRPLTALQRRFIEEYLLDPSPKRAARRAGYSEAFARDNAYRLLKHPDVAAAIREGQAAAQVRAAITVDRIVAELAKLAFADPRDLFTADGRMKPIHELDEANAASIASLEVLVLGGGSRSAAAKAGKEKVRALSGGTGSGETGEESGDVTLELRKIKRWDKTKALELLGRYLGLFKDKVELSAAADLAAAIEAARKRATAPLLAQKLVEAKAIEIDEGAVVAGETPVIEEARVLEETDDAPNDSLSPRGRGSG